MRRGEWRRSRGRQAASSASKTAGLLRVAAPLIFIAPPLVALIINALIFGRLDPRLWFVAGGMAVFAMALVIGGLYWPKIKRRRARRNPHGR